jgi:hypothetical protein
LLCMKINILNPASVLYGIAGCVTHFNVPLSIVHLFYLGLLCRIKFMQYKSATQVKQNI